MLFPRVKIDGNRWVIVDRSHSWQPSASISSSFAFSYPEGLPRAGIRWGYACQSQMSTLRKQILEMEISINHQRYEIMNVGISLSLYLQVGSFCAELSCAFPAYCVRKCLRFRRYQDSQLEAGMTEMVHVTKCNLCVCVCACVFFWGGAALFGDI